MKGLNLCIDIDGTITEAYDWIPRVNDYFNTNIKPKDVTVYEIHRVLGVDRAAYESYFMLYTAKHYIKKLELEEGCQKFLAICIDSIKFISLLQEKKE